MKTTKRKTTKTPPQAPTPAADTPTEESAEAPARPRARRDRKPAESADTASPQPKTGSPRARRKTTTVRGAAAPDPTGEAQESGSAPDEPESASSETTMPEAEPARRARAPRQTKKTASKPRKKAAASGAPTRRKKAASRTGEASAPAAESSADTAPEEQLQPPVSSAPQERPDSPPAASPPPQVAQPSEPAPAEPSEPAPAEASEPAPAEPSEVAAGAVDAAAFAGARAIPIPPPTFEPAPAPVPWRPDQVVFIDVENTSREASLNAVLDQLDLSGLGTTTEVVALGNWRVIGQGLARALAGRGVQLVHTAPATGVRDWSDLWIAVQAGIWLGRAKAGDSLVIVSHDRAFDAIGDAAQRLGVRFQRVTYGRDAPAQTTAETSRRAGSGSGGRRRGGGRGTSRSSEPAGGTRDEGAQAATPDQIVAVLRKLTESDPVAGAPIDWLSDALKASGFHRPPGSTRLVTRLKRIKNIEVLANGRIRLASAAPGDAVSDGDDQSRDEPRPDPAGTAKAPDTPAPSSKRRSRRRGGRRRGGGSREDAAAGPEPGPDAVAGADDEAHDIEEVNGNRW